MKGEVENAGEDEKYYKHISLYPLVQGGIITLAGAILLFFPKVGLIFLSVTFGLYLLMQGISQTVLSFRVSDSRANWWKLLIRGCLLIIAGVLILWYPFSFAKIGMGIPLVTGGIFLIISNLQDLMAPDLRSPGRLRIGNIVMLVIGILLCFAPVFSALFLFRLIGFLTLIGGVLLILSSRKIL